MGAAGNDPFRAGDGGLLVAIRVRPGASANRIEGIVVADDGGGRIAVRVTAAPDKGKANKAVVRLLAKAWKMAPGSISVIAGANQRNKTLLLAGESDVLQARLDAWLKSASGT